MSIDTFSFPTTIRFGVGARDLLPAELAASGVCRPLVVTDKGVSGLPFCGEILALAGSGGNDAALFDGVWGNPVASQVAAGVEAYRAHDADGVVGLGGGAALDVAKAVALMATHPGELFDYEDEKPGGSVVTDAVCPIVAVPTTAGTGSEVGRAAVISEDDTHVKRIIFGPALLARVVLADPQLTVDLPGPITAATGMDALTHNVEAYLARHYHPICDGIALEGIRQVATHLERAVAEPGDLDARGGMLMASMMGAIAFQKGLGLVHSCAHALGTVADVHHGLANGVMIDLALPFNVEAVPERFEHMATAAAISDVSPAGFLGWLADLKAAVGIPRALVDLGIDPDLQPELVRVAANDACHPNNPRPVTAADFDAIFTKAFA
ncbi:MAG: iron-containing alcohol dehydrogenase [Acidimicrobiia bacterium]|nr:iron-containing alcohol dehydrogenase [Acidimicrobiia bacterium]